MIYLMRHLVRKRGQSLVDRLLSSLKVLQDKGTGAILRLTMTSVLAI